VPFIQQPLKKERLFLLTQTVTLIITCVIDQNNPHPVWVETTQGFTAMLAELLKEPVVAVDTESNSLHAYQEQVCLVQFSTPERDFLLDPLAGLDLHPLGAFFSSKKIEKVFHACEYDVICLRRDFSFTFNHIFDTMQTARILGMEKFSLGDLVEAEFGLHLDKHNQKADWAQRPLTLSMQTYACLDTHYLIPLREKMTSQLNTRGLMELAEEDFVRLCSSSANGDHKPLYTQVSGYQDLSSRQLAVLNEICAYRDRRAKLINQPHFKVVSNQALLAIAQICPKNEQGLRKVEELPMRLLERHAEGLLTAVRRGLQAKPIELPYRQRPDGWYLNRLDKLKTWRKYTAERLQVLSDVILPRDVLEEIASQNPQSLLSLKSIMRSVPWRFAHFGAELLDLTKEKK
jgi:ribonuclease D